MRPTAKPTTKFTCHAKDTEMTNSKQIIRLIVGVSNSEGAPELIPVSVECTDEQIFNGDHYDMADAIASDMGYSPKFRFDERDPAWKQMNAAAGLGPLPDPVTQGWLAAISNAKHEARKVAGQYMEHQLKKLDEIHYFLNDVVRVNEHQQEKIAQANRAAGTNHFFNFARREEGMITTLGILEIASTNPDEGGAWDAMIDAITEWVNTTEAGRRAWIGSSKDLNIGDLASFDAFQDKDLSRLMAERGLTFKSLMIADSQDDCADYDEVLINYETLKDTDEEGGNPNAPHP